MEQVTQRESLQRSTQICPYCRDEIAANEEIECASCGTQQHIECALEHGRCATIGCESVEFRYVAEPELGVVELAYVEHQPRTAAERQKEAELDAEWESRHMAEYDVPDHERFQLRSRLFATVIIVAGCIYGSINQLLPGAGGIVIPLAIAALWVVHHRYPSTYRGKTGARPVSLWHDILGNKGFDPITGVEPPRIQPNDDRGPGSV